ncbi:MAG: hypothetical protein ABUL71_05735, partial [Gemmatimonadota bacterium]
MIRQIAPLAALAFVAACADAAISPIEYHSPGAAQSLAQEPVVICHQPDQAANLITVGAAAMPAHLAHGDYVARLSVDPAITPGDGIHFRRITDAILAARATRFTFQELTAAACRISIDVVAGAFKGSFDAGVDPAFERLPLIIDVPDITLRGALVMQMDGAGRATGASDHATTLLPDRPIAFSPVGEDFIIVAGHPDGSLGDGAVIQGFAFQSGRNDGSAGGLGIMALRASRVVIRGNRFEQGLMTAVDLRASSAVVENNHAAHLGANCAFCLAGPGE